MSLGDRPSSMIFLAENHGHVDAHTGRVNQATLAFLEGYVNLGWDLLHLGPVSPQARPRVISVGDDASWRALLTLCETLRALQPGLRLGVEVCDERWPLEAWAKLARAFDWISMDATLLAHYAPLLHTSPPGQLCVDVQVDVDAAPHLVTHSIPHPELVQLIDVVHVRHARHKILHRIGGSERASAKLGRIAAALVHHTSLALMVSGRIKHGEDARRVCSLHGASFVGMHRGALAMPDVLERDARGAAGVYCTGCMACERVSPADYAPTTCALRFSREFVTALRAAPPARLHIFGASYGALTLAMVAAEAGVAHVNLWMLGETPGGCMRFRGRVPNQAESAEAVLTRLEECRAHASIVIDREVHSAATLHAHVRAQPGPCVLAMMPELAWDDAWTGVTQTWSAFELLRRGSLPPDRDDDAVWIVRGDTLLAAECALYMRMQWREVWWAGEQLAADADPVWQAVYRERLVKRGVVLMSEQECVAMRKGRAEVYVVMAGGALTRSAAATRIHELLPDLYMLDDVYEPRALRHIMGRFRLNV